KGLKSSKRERRKIKRIIVLFITRNCTLFYGFGVGVGVVIGAQLTLFSVPRKKYSVCPIHCLETTSEGIWALAVALPPKRPFISLFQMGAAPVIPDANAGFIGELSLFPTQTATTF